jgi:regulator of RNase E activity RraA
VNVPIACGGVTVIPGDIIMADDDGVVVLPPSMAAKVIEDSKKHAEWEVFSRDEADGARRSSRYYPLHADAEGRVPGLAQVQPAEEVAPHFRSRSRTCYRAF